MISFFYAYVFEILRDLDKDYNFKLSSNYGSNEDYLKATGEYRKTYQQKFMQVRKNKELSKNFEIWKKQVKEKNQSYEKRKTY